MIVRCWGEADSFSLEFTQGADGKWRANVVPDFEDGQYAVQLFAMNDIGAIGIYTGMLYMYDGTTCLHINDEPVHFVLLPELITTDVLPERVKLELLQECPVHG